MAWTEQKLKPENLKQIRNAGLWILLTGVILLSLGLSRVDPIGLITGFGYTYAMIVKMYPPAYPNWPYLLKLAAETIAMGAIGTVLGTILAFPLGFLSARNTSSGPATYHLSRSLVSLLRSVPQLIFAMLFAVAFGLGLLPGIIAITVSTVGMLSKFFSEAVESIDPGPVEALTATGSHRLGVIRHGILPQVSPVFMGYMLYMLDNNIRDAIIIGIVGGGGLGLALYVQLAVFHFHSVAAILLVTVFMIVIINRLSFYLRKGFIDGTLLAGRRRPLDLALLALLPLGLAACIYYADLDFSRVSLGIPLLLDLGAGLLHPTFRYFDASLYLLIQTIAISIAGTTLAVFLAVPLGILAARNVVKNSILRTLVREFLSFLRGIPELLLAILFVASVGMGPFPGVLALAIHTSSILGEFYAQAIENINPGPTEAVESTGARPIQRIRHVIFPQVVPAFISYNLFIFDRNLRMSTILGVVGAGGIGTAIEANIRGLQIGEASGLILLVLITIWAADLLSAYVRKKVV